MSPAPRPCPFCGAAGLAHTIAGVPYDGPLDLEGMLGMAQPGIGWYQVTCIACGAGGPKVKASSGRAAEAAIAAWNRRDGEGRLL
jgi:hypothetical protein